MNRIVILFALLACAAASPDNEPAKDGELSGVYHLVGVENGKTYYGVCVISHEDGIDIVSAVHVVGGGVTHGIGVRKGDTIALAWKQTVPANGTIGSTLYTISKDKKTLEGLWVTPGTDVPRKETLRFLRKVKDRET